MIHDQAGALTLDFCSPRIAQGTWLCVGVHDAASFVWREATAVVCLAFSAHLPLVFFVRRWLYVFGIRIGSVGFLGGPSYQAGRILSVEVTGLSPAAVSSVLTFCFCTQEPWAVSTAMWCLAVFTVKTARHHRGVISVDSGLGGVW